MKAFFENNFDFDLKSLKYSNCFGDEEIGEIFIEYLNAYDFVMQNGVMRVSSAYENAGFGIRKVLGEQLTYLCDSNISTTNINKAFEKIYKFDKKKSKSDLLFNDNKTLYRNLYDKNIVIDFEKNIELIKKIDYLITKYKEVVNYTISLSNSIQNILIIQPDGTYFEDARPLIKLSVSVVVEKNKKHETGSAGIGGRVSIKYIEEKFANIVETAVKQANINIEAIQAPAGEIPVVLSSGWTGIILHEAVGHGLEADFNRKKTSAFTNCMGKLVASEKVTVVDDGTVPNQRGSINFDDEGTVSQRNILIENGILKSYMYDKQNAKLMGTTSTGNGRRESFKYAPCPRMTNTYMLGGESSFDEIVDTVKHGIYAVSFSGGQVDITSGKFVFSASEAYLIQDGKITKPIKGVSLVGDGPSILKQVSMVANDFNMDPGIGTCGKDGQNLPVCVGQPSIKIDKITVGGTVS